MAAPVGTYVGQILEPMWNAMIDFFFITILEIKSVLWKYCPKSAYPCI
jgi:hypothetical protein